MLKRMGRRHTKEQTRELLERLRAEIPGLVLRTTFIVGFPGETEEHFQEILDFVEEFRFERLGVFPYSHEPNTPAGENFEDDVPAEVKAERVDRLMALQQPIAFAHAEALVGKTISVLVEGPTADPDLTLGRSPYDAPEIDPVVYLRGEGFVSGSMIQVKVTAAEGYDLVGESV